VRAVASGAVLANSASKAPLRATALSLSHLTWSFGLSTTAFRTCHPTTSFPVYLQIITMKVRASTEGKHVLRKDYPFKIRSPPRRRSEVCLTREISRLDMSGGYLPIALLGIYTEILRSLCRFLYMGSVIF
jgi:hypothetical protein